MAVWHGTYNLSSATLAAHGLLAAVATTVVIVLAVTLVVADLASHGRVLAPCPRAGETGVDDLNTGDQEVAGTP